VDKYWYAARKHVEEEYASIHFPFEKIQSERFELRVEWDLHQFMGYLRSWSATQKFIKAEGYDPLVTFSDQLKKAWAGSEKKTVIFPIFLKLCSC